MFLRGLRPRRRCTIYTPMLPMSRGESFLENRVFADPDTVEWESPGRADPARLRQALRPRRLRPDRAWRRSPTTTAARFVTGRVVHVGSPPTARGCGSSSKLARGDVAPSATTSSSTAPASTCCAQLRGLFPDAVRDEVEEQCGPLWDRPPETEVPIGRGLELEGMRPRLHIPGLGGLRQGPGFANLGSLGLLANRVLQPLLLERGRRWQPGF